MKYSWIRLVVWSLAAVVLIVLFLRLFDTSFASAAERLSSAPLWMWGSVLALNFIMVMIGAIKWRIIRQWVSPDSTPVDYLAMVSVTAAGSFATFFLPPQPAHLLVRWWAFRKGDVANAGVLGSTFFEQVYDLIVYLGAAILALVLLWLDLDGPILAAATCAGLALILLSARLPLAIFVGIAAFLGNDRMPEGMHHFMHAAEATFRSARTRPINLLMVLSLILLVCRVLTILAIAWAISPGLNLLLVAAAFPAVSLLSAIPITPAGLGVAEWTWGALLIAAGVPLTDAAITALGFRLVNAAALLLLLVVLAICRGAQK